MTIFHIYQIFLICLTIPPVRATPKVNRFYFFSDTISQQNNSSKIELICIWCLEQKMRTQSIDEKAMIMQCHEFKDYIHELLLQNKMGSIVRENSKYQKIVRETAQRKKIEIQRYRNQFIKKIERIMDQYQQELYKAIDENYLSLIRQHEQNMVAVGRMQKYLEECIRSRQMLKIKLICSSQLGLNNFYDEIYQFITLKKSLSESYSLKNIKEEGLREVQKLFIQSQLYAKIQEIKNMMSHAGLSARASNKLIKPLLNKNKNQLKDSYWKKSGKTSLEKARNKNKSMNNIWKVGQEREIK